MKWTWLAVAAILLVIAVLSFDREYPAFNTETDFVGSFVHDAERLLAGEPMRVQNHPPLYPIMLALGRLTGAEWFSVGRWLSWLSAAVLLFAAARVFARLYGPAAAYGSLLGLGSCWLFLLYAAQATSDVFSVGAIYLSAAAFLSAFDRPTSARLLAAGVCLGLCLLTRTNTLSFLLLAGYPLLRSTSWKQRSREFAIAVCGIALPLVLWFGFATWTGSNLAPAGGLRDTLAVTYFVDRDLGGGADALSRIEGRFETTADVLLYDPPHLLFTYIKDALGAVRRLFWEESLYRPPLNLLSGLGLIFLLAATRNRVAALFAAALLAQAALVNLKTFSGFGARFYLFAVPAAGAGMGLLVAAGLRRVPAGTARGIVTGAIALLAAVPTLRGFRLADFYLNEDAAELSAAIPATRSAVNDTSVLASRKPHIPFYTGAAPAVLPRNVGLDGLERWARSTTPRPDLLYYGSVERGLRPDLLTLADAERAPAWLVPVAHGSEGGGWVLYRIDLR